jgi:hypothetical protein
MFSRGPLVYVGRWWFLQKVFEEAELCLEDLREVSPGTDDYDDECICANGAVNNAFTAYVDLLEDLRRANSEQLQDYNEVRNSYACNLKRLRQELDEIMSSTAANKVA